MQYLNLRFLEAKKLKREYGARVDVIDLPQLTTSGGARIKRLGGRKKYDSELGRNASGASRQQSFDAQKKRGKK